MVGGEAVDVAVLQHLSDNRTHLGPGQTPKPINEIRCPLNLMAVAEATNRRWM